MNVRRKPHVHPEGWKMLSKETGPQLVRSSITTTAQTWLEAAPCLSAGGWRRRMGTIHATGWVSLLRSSVRCRSMYPSPKDRGQIHRSVYLWVLRSGKFKDGKQQPWWLPRAGRGCEELVFSELSVQQDKEPWCVTVWTCFIDMGVHAWK